MAKCNLRWCGLLSLAFVAMSGCQPTSKAPAETPESTNAFRLSAEFETTAAIWLLWPNTDHLKGSSNETSLLALIEALLPHTRIKLVVPNAVVQERLLQGPIGAYQQRGQLRVYQIPYTEFWTRDMGPEFLMNAAGELAIADFRFNSWGYAAPDNPSVAEDAQLDARIGQVLKIPVIASDLISEGGDHESNGRGLLIACEQVELSRNPGKTLAQIEAEFKRVLGAQKVIWMKKGLREDDATTNGPLQGPNGEAIYTPLTTNGHVDEYVRFVDTNTVILAEANPAVLNDPIMAENQRRMDENYAILSRATDQNGKPLNIIRMPLPYPVYTTMRPGDPVYDQISQLRYANGHVFPKGQPVKVVAAASYLNFLIVNDAVLVPKYFRSGQDPAVNQLDEQAIAIIQRVYLKKRIIPLEVLGINFGGGGIHCITRNEPMLRPVYQ